MEQIEGLIGAVMIVCSIILVYQEFTKKDGGVNEDNIWREGRNDDRKSRNSEITQLPPALKEGFFISKERRILKHKWKKHVPWTRLANEVMCFTEPILRERGISKKPHITLRYYKNKSRMGVYFGGSQGMVIYVKSHSTIREFVDTVLHEICHHIQNRKKSNEFKYYDDYTRRYGYYNNPLEVESRRFAKDLAPDCLEHLYQKRMIS